MQAVALHSTGTRRRRARGKGVGAAEEEGWFGELGRRPVA